MNSGIPDGIRTRMLGLEDRPTPFFRVSWRMISHAKPDFKPICVSSRLKTVARSAVRSAVKIALTSRRVSPVASAHVLP
jgi:hypothetical protein